MNVTASQIAQEFGFSARHWTRAASAGKVPGACQPSGPGGHWLFDVALFRRWWTAKQKDIPEWQGYTSAVQRGGAGFNVKVRNTGKASEQEIAALLKSVCGSG